MIRVMGMTIGGTLNQYETIKDARKAKLHWMWVDFSKPTEREGKELSRTFSFHPLAIEDCVEKGYQRPKFDSYQQYIFLVLHHLTKDTYEAEEIDVFVNEKLIVTWHYDQLSLIDDIWDRQLSGNALSGEQSPVGLLHSILDVTVDDYFPSVYGIEDVLNRIEEKTDENSSRDLMDGLFDVRHDMQKLRRSLVPTRDLLYRLLNGTNVALTKDQQLYFSDVYDHVIKLTEMLESYREFSSDIRDNYISVSSDKMNNIMMTLTVITTIFMPLSFLAGLYGMNFVYIPELEFQYGYFVLLGVMLFIATVMFMIFRKIGWLQFSKSKKKKRKRIFKR
ncbi:magnesium/cobalt transporter CorA [Jeotgalibacillus salarius]|uniref:Magnesium transport protein CorA n=1 Tax=Jeotgalibacillus salarius TaxID=546023 RepID=A0A4Y8LID9_9BACL|nr:magnesium/cobalt transporter CorA [Jeotgalibacillus salarius]TFE00327.1 magnesium/cobalt transporter CorA [Jeotgalibacillus salarius]